MKLDRMINIKNVDIESNIKESIAETMNDLNGLTDERTCMIYTGYLYLKLLERHILSYVVDTYDDLKMDYKHQFIIVPKNGRENYIIDLTYSQFGLNQEFTNIYDKGYQLLSKEMYQKYLDNIKNIKTIKNK